MMSMNLLPFLLTLLVLASVSASTITSGLYAPGKISVALYDFDKTMVVNSFGEAVLLEYCDPTCSYEACNCTGEDDLANALINSEDPESLVLEAFGGQERLDRLNAHYDALVDAGVDLYIVSTSWYSVPAAAWANFIFASLEYAGIDKYFPMEMILTLDDPGDGIAADKGLVIRNELEDLDLDAYDAIFADDSEGNFLSAVQGTLSAETLYVQPRTGLDTVALSYIEQRANASDEVVITELPITSTITRGFSDPKSISVAMYDFDKTMVVDSFGEVILLEYCDPMCNYEACNCTGENDLANALKDSDDPEALVLEAFGGQELLNRVNGHYDILVDAGVDLYIVSTSWYSVPADAWGNFIFSTLEYAGLDSYFPSEKILTLDDPGDGIAADKGLVIRNKLEALSLNASDAIFVDDSEGNFLSSVQGSLSAETLYVQPRTGLSNDALAYIEERANASALSPGNATTSAGNGVPFWLTCANRVVVVVVAVATYRTSF